MGFYLRKAFTLGPLRLNLSRSGLGLSLGVKGARLGLGPRGTYVHMGRQGVYYRQFVSPSAVAPPWSENSAPPFQLTTEEGMQEFESADVSQMVDIQAGSLLAKLNRVAQRPDLLPWVLASSAAASLTLWGLGASLWAMGSILLLGFGAALYARHQDVTQGTVVLDFDLEADAAEQFTRLKSSFEQLAGCGAIWHVEAAGETRDWKHHAGASSIVRRNSIRPRFDLPPRVASNLKVPVLAAGQQTLYFFPDRLLVYAGTRVGAIRYHELVVKVGSRQFIEEETVPRDAEIVGQTWRYVNKSGGPDRRFRDNPQLPIARYGTIHLSSPSGLNELFHCSQVNACVEFARALAALELPLSRSLPMTELPS